MKRAWFLMAVALLPLLTSFNAKADNDTVRWDIANFVNGGLYAGGTLTQCIDQYPIVAFTGSGTFKLKGNGKATGGGNWTMYPYAGNPGSSGTYVVTELVSFEVSTGSLVPSGYTDFIGNLADARGGLAFLRILYSDGSQGVLVVVGTVHNEGTIYVSKGDSFYSFPPCPGPTDNYPLGPSPIFHITAKGDN
jgi:hypothetical protein